MRGPRLSDERGIALAVAIFALVVIGALVAGTFYAGRLEQQTGENSFYANQAGEAAQAALTQAVQTETSAALLAMATDPNTQPTSLSSLSLGGKVYGNSTVQRLTASVWLVKATGQKTNAQGGQLATKSVAQLIRLNEAELDVSAGLTAIGKVTVSGNSTVSGYDATPDYWQSVSSVNCPPLDSVAGVRFNGQVTQQGSAVIKGDPVRDQDNTLTASNMLGGTTFSELKGFATLILTGNISGLGAATTGNPLRCDTSVQNNWGAPTNKNSPCFTYFPIIYHLGDLSISGSGEGQGILLVEGNLNVQGTIDFYGPVIATGGVNIRGTGSDDVKFYGGVMAQDVTLDDSKLSGNAMINFSSCAIRRALQGSALPIALDERSWVQVY
jgi:Tfp pilus assembly protein PilX